MCDCNLNLALFTACDARRRAAAAVRDAASTPEVPSRREEGLARSVVVTWRWQQRFVLSDRWIIKDNDDLVVALDAANSALVAERQRLIDLDLYRFVGVVRIGDDAVNATVPTFSGNRDGDEYQVRLEGYVYFDTRPTPAVVPPAAQTAYDNAIAAINDEYCANRCTAAEESTCRARSNPRIIYTPAWNSATEVCDCNPRARTGATGCTTAQITACPGVVAGTHELDDNCRCVPVQEGCTATQRATCAARAVDGLSTAFRESDCSCTETRVECAAAQRQTLIDAAPEGEQLVSATWTSTGGLTGTCTGTYEPIATGCTQAQTDACAARTTSSTTYALNAQCQCVGTAVVRTGCTTSEAIACFETAAREGYVNQVFWEQEAQRCDCREIPSRITTPTCTQTQRDACTTADNLRAEGYRYVFRESDCTCQRGERVQTGGPCADTPPCGNANQPNPLNDCACEPVDCSRHECADGYGPRHGPADPDTGHFGGCTCVRLACARGLVRNPDTGECEEPAFEGQCGNEAWRAIRDLIQRGGQNRDGTPFTVFDACAGQDDAGNQVESGQYFDLLNCRCRPICTNPATPRYIPTHRRGRDGNPNAACAPWRVPTAGCPPGTSRNDAGECVQYVPEPPPPGPGPAPPPIAPLPCPPGTERSATSGNCVAVVLPPAPIPPCAKQRSTSDWRCVRPVAVRQNIPVGGAGCAPPARRDPGNLHDLACATLATPATPIGSRLSAAIWLERNG